METTQTPENKRDNFVGVLQKLSVEEVNAIQQWGEKEFFMEYAPKGKDNLEIAVRVISASVYSYGAVETARKINEYLGSA